jgi:membrane protease YdiL (CAAX protease family)
MSKGVVVAWVWILLVAIGLPVLSALPEGEKSPDPAGQSASLQSLYFAKYTVGIGQVASDQMPALQAQVDASAETPADRIVAAVVSAETLGVETAKERLAALSDNADAEAFLQWYTSQQALPQEVVTRYGFAARLAMTIGLPESDPSRASVLRTAELMVFGVFGIFGTVLLGFLAGCVLLILGIVLLCTRSITLQPVGPMPDSGVYVQAFAVYLGLIVVGSLLMGFLPDEVPMAVRVLPLPLAVCVGIAYPLLRGVSGAVMRRDWGLHTGRGVLLESLLGACGYLAGLPLIAAGIAVTVLLSWLTGANVQHPISEEFSGQKLLIVLLAVVFAPVTEEILFRGGFLAHCRSFSGWVVSGLIVGVVFAAIHPQGWAGIPALASIGFVMAMIRAWRGSIVGPIVAHAINNGTVVLLLMLMVM